MKEDEILLSLWKETRTTINHIDKMMDGARARVFTLFGTITSVAAALYYWAPNVFILSIRLSALVQLITILIIVPSFVQNRLYHFWLFKSINTSLELENLIMPKLKKEAQSSIMVTHSLTELEKRTSTYWEAMKHSKLFGVEMAIFLFMIAACIGLVLVFQYCYPIDVGTQN